MRARAAGALALAVAVLGCGGDDSESFKDDYLAESDQIEGVGRDIATALTGAPRKSNDALARQFAGLARRAQSSVDDLEDLDPPEDLTDERDKLVVALDTGTADLRRIASAARAGDTRRARNAARKLVSDSAEIRDARPELDRLAREE